jgi:hypothetical protein
VRDASAERLAQIDGVSAADAARIRAFFAALDAPPAAPEAAEPESPEPAPAAP